MHFDWKALQHVDIPQRVTEQWYEHDFPARPHKTLQDWAEVQQVFLVKYPAHPSIQSNVRKFIAGIKNIRDKKKWVIRWNKIMINEAKSTQKSLDSIELVSTAPNFLDCTQGSM